MRVIALLTLLLLHSIALAAELSVKVDRQKLYEDESLVLSVQLRNGAAAFDPIIEDFEIVQRSQGSQVQYINGVRSDSQSWEFVLAPKRAGLLSIPAFEMAGAISEELKVTVESIGSRAQQNEDRPFFLRTSVSNKTPFVQQQIIYTMKLYQQTPIVDGNVTEPDHADIQIERLGLDRSYMEQVDGREYSVLERRYALFAQRSGEIVLPAINLNARVSTGQSTNRLFAPDTRNIRVRAQSITLDVKAATDAYRAAWWLASSNVVGEAKWQPEDAQVGQPLTLEVLIAAEGVMPAQIPVIADPSLPSVRMYSDGSRAAKKAGAEGVVSQRVTRWTIIPMRPGKLEVAAFTLPWWDLESNSQKTLTINVPALHVTGEMPADSVLEPSDEVQIDNGGEAEDQQVVASEESSEAKAKVWLWFSDWRTQVVLVSIVALASLVIRRRRRRPLPLQTDEQLRSPDAAMVRLFEAVTRADVKTARDALLDWGTGTFGQEIRSLPHLAERVDDPEFSKLILELDVLCYRDKGRWYGEPLQEKLKAYKPQQSAVADKDELPFLS